MRGRWGAHPQFGRQFHVEDYTTVLPAIAQSVGIPAVLTGVDAGNWVGDEGYVGNNMITPIKKPAHRDLLDWEKEFNTQVNKIRWIIEQVIAHLKTWRILHTDYRRPIDTFPTTISAIIAPHFWSYT